MKCAGTSVPTFAFCLFTFSFLESEPPYVNARSRREGSDSVLNCACSRRSHRPFRLCGPDRRLKMAQTSLAPVNPALRMVAPREHQQASQASGMSKCTVRASEGPSSNAFALNNFPDYHRCIASTNSLNLTLIHRRIDLF